MRILADSTLPGLTEAFPKPFILSLYANHDELLAQIKDQDVLLCRSTLKVNAEWLTRHNLRYVATASSGTDHLDKAFLHAQNIEVLDARGSNASSVADYVLSCIAWLAMHQSFKGQNIGIIGLGKVGEEVARRLLKAQFQLTLYDPLKAMKETTFRSAPLEQLYKADLLCIHAELHTRSDFPSLNLLNEAFLAALKPGAVIINAARGGIVDEQALLASQKALTYCTDVFLNEPSIDPRIVERTTLCTPHIAGHSIEAKIAAVTQISEQLHRILQLPVPQFLVPTKPKLEPLTKDLSWQEQTLALYNPEQETNCLKQARDKRQAFLELRKNHQFRHNFEVYP